MVGLCTSSCMTGVVPSCVLADVGHTKHTICRGSGLPEPLSPAHRVSADYYGLTVPPRADCFERVKVARSLRWAADRQLSHHPFTFFLASLIQELWRVVHALACICSVSVLAVVPVCRSPSWHSKGRLVTPAQCTRRGSALGAPASPSWAPVPTYCTAHVL